MNKPDIEYINSHRYHRRYFINIDFPGYLEYLETKFPYVHDLTQRIWLDIHKYDDYPTCPICGRSVKTFQNFTKGFVKYCCPTCAQSDPIVREKNHKTNIDRYGENYREIITRKCAETKLMKYGSSGYNNPSKFRQTMLKRYGVENPMMLESIKTKTETTCLERYGAKRKILSNDYRKEKRESLNKHLIDIYPEVVDIKDNGRIFICSCPDSTCTLCNEKQFETSYHQYYQRKFKYKIDICPIKRPGFPNKNTDIEVFIQDILNKYDIQYETNNRTILSGKELDIYIPDYKLAIECNGIYWHSLKEPKYHHQKWIVCKNQGIQLLTLWEDQIINQPEIIRNIIMSRLGIYEHKVGASKCKVKSVTSNESNQFLLDNHLQGPVNGSIRLGLYHNDELVSLMVFGRKRTALGNKFHDQWELYRYCCKQGWQIVGGAKRLFTHFINEHPDVEIESFSSNDISGGGLYDRLGFKQANLQPYSYWYIDKNMIRRHRYSYRKDVLVKNGADPSLTEFQITDQMGLFRIYDTGQIKWIYSG